MLCCLLGPNLPFRLVEILQKYQNSRSITLSYFPVIFRSPLANEWLSALIFFCADPPPLPAAAAQVFYRVWLAEDPNTISLSGLSAPNYCFFNQPTHVYFSQSQEKLVEIKAHSNK